MFTKDENERLKQMAVELTYESILLSGLYRELSNEEWDSFAKELANEARSVINRRIQDRIDQAEAARERAKEAA